MVDILAVRGEEGRVLSNDNFREELSILRPGGFRMGQPLQWKRCKPYGE
jgi:hypothetical protein